MSVGCRAALASSAGQTIRRRCKTSRKALATSRGLVHAFRKVTAHEPRVVWHISEERRARYDVRRVAHPSPPGRGYGYDCVSAGALKQPSPNPADYDALSRLTVIVISRFASRMIALAIEASGERSALPPRGFAPKSSQLLRDSPSHPKSRTYRDKAAAIWSITITRQITITLADISQITMTLPRHRLQGFLGPPPPSNRRE